MKFIKKISCLFIAGAMLLPYTVIAEDNTQYYEAVAVDPLAEKDNSSISMFAASNALSGNEISMLEYIVDELTDMPSEIELPAGYQMNEDRFNEVYKNHIGFLIQHEHPEIFYFALNYGYKTLDGKVTALVPQYTMEKDERDAAQKLIDAEINTITEKISGLSEPEKALYIHDYIASHYEYDTSYENRTLDRMVIDKKGVCQGYSYLFMAAAKAAGLECQTVPTDELAHMWNKIKIDGKWYNIDVTSDDPITDRSSSISHDYFLVNDDEIKALDPSKIKCLRIIGNVVAEIDGCTLIENPDTDTVTIMRHGSPIVENGTREKYSEVYKTNFNDENGWYIVYINSSPALLYKETSSHIVWNEYRWDGRNTTELSDSTDYSNSVIHGIQGRTAMKDGVFYCIDNANNICKIIFDENVIRPDYTLSGSFHWYPAGIDGSRVIGGYYVIKDENGKDITYYSSTIAEYNGEIYVNSADKVYRYLPGKNEQGSLAEVYEYDGENKDISRTYFYGLTYDNANDGKLAAEYSTHPNASISKLIEVKITEPDLPAETPAVEPTSKPTAETEIFPVFEEPLPCTVDEPVVVENKRIDEETQEEIVTYDVTISVDIPDEVVEKVEETQKTITVNVAKYSDGAFVGFEEITLDEDNTVTFTAGSECDSVKTFVWAGFIMPLAMAEELNLVSSANTPAAE